MVEKFSPYQATALGYHWLNLVPDTEYIFDLYGIFDLGPPLVTTDVRRIVTSTPRDDPGLVLK